VSVTEVTATGATVSWTTNEVSSSVVSYGPTALTQKVEDTVLVTSHSVRLSGLAPSTHYQLQASSMDASGNRGQGEVLGFDTPAPAAVTLTGIAVSGADGLDAGASASYTVVATYSDASSRTVVGSWSLAGTAARINATSGLLTANTVLDAETVTVTASYQGQSAQKTVTVRAAAGGLPVSSSYAASFAAGWTLAGNGLDAPIDVARTFGAAELAGSVTTVWSWDAVNMTWRFYSPKLAAADLANYVQSKGYQVLATIPARAGYWVNAAKAFSLPQVTGAPVVVTAADLVSGWNLVGVGAETTPPQFNLGLSDAPPAAGVVPKNFTTLWAWDAPSGNWYFYAPVLEAQGPTKNKEYTDLKGYLDFATTNKKLGNGTGFWVNRP
jgi:hypothetical protein